MTTSEEPSPVVKRPRLGTGDKVISEALQHTKHAPKVRSTSKVVGFKLPSKPAPTRSPTKHGRMPGSSGIGSSDALLLLRLVRELEPKGATSWKELADKYNAAASKPRGVDTLRRKVLKLRSSKTILTVIDSALSSAPDGETVPGVLPIPVPTISAAPDPNIAPAPVPGLSTPIAPRPAAHAPATPFGPGLTPSSIFAGVVPDFLGFPFPDQELVGSEPSSQFVPVDFGSAGIIEQTAAHFLGPVSPMAPSTPHTPHTGWPI